MLFMQNQNEPEAEKENQTSSTSQDNNPDISNSQKESLDNLTQDQETPFQ
jgi:hypothetical protein